MQTNTRQRNHLTDLRAVLTVERAVGITTCQIIPNS